MTACGTMDSNEGRINAAQLAALRTDFDPANAIASLLRVDEMPPEMAIRTRREIAQYIESGDGVVAAQLIHVAIVRRSRKGKNLESGGRNS